MNHFNRSRRLPLTLAGIFLCAATLSGCNGGSSISSQAPDPDNGQPDNGQDPGGQPSVSSDPALETVAADSVIRSAMLDYYTNVQDGSGGGVAIDMLPVALESTADTATDSNADGAIGSRFSDTNVQESGVDESDRVKRDGNIMFALEELDTQSVGIVPVPFEGEIADAAFEFRTAQNVLSAYRLDKENSAQLSRLVLNEYASGMYLHKNGDSRDLVLLSSGSFDWAYWSSPHYFMNGQTKVSWVDASDAGNLSVGRTLTIDGQMISSRKIDNQLILVTRYHPSIEGIVLPYDNATVEDNRRIIETTAQDKLVPRYTLTDGNATTNGSVISNNRCYQHADSADGSDESGDALFPYYESPSVISIITIDLNDQSAAIENTCFIGQSETVYVSLNALYLATTRYRYQVSTDSLQRPLVDYYPPEITTEVHKFRFTDNGAPEFRGSAAVSGHLGWYEDRKPFRMSEKHGNLRIVTFDQNRSGSPVTLNILAEGSGGRLTTLSTLPNESRPAPIGEPNENLYASRFIDDRAYLVTFRITDPLYVLDLSDPYDPRIAGELKLPGYSEYLHPVNDNLLVGVGKDAVSAEGSGWGDGRGAFYQGVKLVLFDVSDPANPIVADNRIFGKRGTDSPALYQHHSFAWLPAGAGRNARMAIPLSLHDEPLGDGQREAEPWEWANWTSNNMLKIEVDAAGTSFVDLPDWVFESRADGHSYSPVSLYNDRAVIGADGGLYVIHNGSLYYGEWSSAASVSATQ